MKGTPVRPIKSDALAHDVDPLIVGEVGVLGDNLGHDLQAVVRTVLHGKQEINLVRTQSNILQITHSCQQLMDARKRSIETSMRKRSLEWATHSLSSITRISCEKPGAENISF